MFIDITITDNNIFIKSRNSLSLREKMMGFKGVEYSYKDRYWVMPNNKINGNLLSKIFNPAYLRIKQYLELKGYSCETKKVYISHIRRFLDYINRDINDLNVDDTKRYLHYLLKVKKCSNSYSNQAISAIRFLYSEVLNIGIFNYQLPRANNRDKLPAILSEHEVAQILQSVKNIKHKTILFLLYASGLRVGEVVSLSIDDIDRENMLIRVRPKEGKQARNTVLSQVALDQLKIYFDMYKPRKWLFPGGNEEAYLTKRTVQKIFKRACRVADIDKNISIHSLRHSFATHQLQNGTDLGYIKNLLEPMVAEKAPKYGELSEANIYDLQSPLDRLISEMEEEYEWCSVLNR